MQANSKPFYFILSVFIIVLAVSFLGHTFSVFGLQFKNINIISDLLPVASSDTSGLPVPKAEKSDIDSIPDFRKSESIIGYEKNGTLEAFIKALEELRQGKRKKVRVGYFGDSMIEGDLITQDIRNMLQGYFGGSGVGFVPVTSVTAGFRQSIVHSFSSNWLDENFRSAGKDGLRSLYLSGHAFRPGESSLVQYSPGRYNAGRFNEIYLVYGPTDSTSTFTLNDSVMTFQFHNLVNKQCVGTSRNEIKARFSGSKDLLYGFSFESERGVFVDNFSFRGISGIELRHLSPEVLESIHNVQSYDLIVLQYGANLLFSPDLKDFGWYREPLKNTIVRLESSFPEASILIIGTADKACRYDGEYRTQKGVLPLIEIQNQVAQETKVNFWNLYNSMGGRNSMIRWVNSNPPLANIDYTHLTHKGANQIARLLFNKLMDVYDPEVSSRSQIQPIVRHVNASRGL